MKIPDKLKKCWEWSKEHWGWLLLGVLFVLLVVTVWVLWTLPPEGGATQQNAAVTASSPTGMKQLQARMWTDRSIVGPKGEVQLKLWFETSTSDPLPKIEIVDVQEPGFMYVPLNLDATGSSKSRLEVAGPIKLSPSTDHGRYRVTVRYRVTDAQGQVHEGAISSGPITIRDERVEKRQLRFRRLIALFKDLTLPLVLAGLGFWFQRWQGRRDEELKRKETKEARRREKKEAAEASRQEIWKTILPHFYELSEKHYLPIVRSLRMVNRYRLKDWTAATQEEKDRLLYEFLFLLLRMKVFREDKGQFFFKSRLGEMVVSDTWGPLFLGSRHYLGQERIDDVLEKMTVETTYKEFRYLLQVSQPIKDTQTKFADWNAKPVEEQFYRYTSFSVIMQGTLYFEANRPFDRDWYGTPTEFDLTKLEGQDYPTAPANAPGIKDFIDRLKREIPSYKKEIEEYFKTLPKLDLP